MTAPLLQQSSPLDNATGVAVTANLVLVFNEAVRAGSGYLRIYKSDGTLFHSIAITDTSQVTFSTAAPARVLINPNIDLLPGTGYYVLIDPGAIEDLSGADYAGTVLAALLNFTTAGTAPSDATAPLLTATSPLDDATNVPVSTNLVLTFNEAVKAGSGTIEIRNVSDGSIAKIDRGYRRGANHLRRQSADDQSDHRSRGGNGLLRHLRIGCGPRSCGQRLRRHLVGDRIQFHDRGRRHHRAASDKHFANRRCDGCFSWDESRPYLQ